MISKTYQIILLQLFCSSILLAGVGENFEPGGIQIGGNGSFAYVTHWKDNDYQLKLYPEFEYFLCKNYSWSASPGFTKSNDSYAFTLLGAMNYYIVPNPEKSNGAIYSIGLNGIIDLSNEPYDMPMRNEEDRYKNSMYLSIAPQIRYSYFINQHIAPYISLYYKVILDEYMLSEKNDIFPAAYPVTTETGILFGIGFFIPTKEKNVIKFKNK